MSDFGPWALALAFRVYKRRPFRLPEGHATAHPLGCETVGGPVSRSGRLGCLDLVAHGADAGESHRGPLPPLSPAERALHDALARDVQQLAADIGERNVFVARKLRAAADYLESTLANAGYKVQRHGFDVSGELCHNLEAELPGQTQRHEIIVVGATTIRCPARPAPMTTPAVWRLCWLWPAPLRAMKRAGRCGLSPL